MRKRSQSHAWTVAQVCQTWWLENTSACPQARRHRIFANRYIHNLQQRPRGSCLLPELAPCFIRPPSGEKATKSTTTCSHTSYTSRHFSTRTPRSESDHTSKDDTSAKDCQDPPGNLVLSAALQQSNVTMAHTLVETTLQLLKRKNPAMAWECYTDMTAGDLLRYMSRHQFKQLIKSFNHASSHSTGIHYVLTLIEDMKSLGYAVGRKEKMIVLRLLGINGKLDETEKLFRDLISEQLPFKDDADIQKPYNILLTSYQQHAESVGKKRAAVRSLEIYGDLIDRGLRPGEASTRILMENVRGAGNSTEEVELVWEWLWNKVGMTVGKRSGELHPMLYKDLAMYFASAGRTEYALEVNDMMVKKNMKRDERMLTALIHKVGRAGDIKKAMALLDEMTVVEGIIPGTVTFNALIDIYAHNKPEPDIDGASRMYERMDDLQLKPDVKTFGALIDMFAKTSDLPMVRRLYKDMIKKHKVQPSAHIFSSLIECFVKNGDNRSAVDILRILRDSKPYGVSPTDATYNLLIRSYVKNGSVKDAFLLLNLMVEARLKPSAITFNPIISLFADNGDIVNAQKVTLMMTRMGIEADVYTYNLLLKAFARAGDIGGAEKLFEALAQRWRPNTYAYNSMLYVYAKCNEVKRVLDTYQQALKSFVTVNEYSYSILMMLYSQRREWKTVESIFDMMNANQVKPSVYSWTILMQTYFYCDQPEEARKVLERMAQANVEPSPATLAVLVKGCLQAEGLEDAEPVLRSALEQLLQREEEYTGEMNRALSDHSALADVAAASTHAYTDRLPVTIEDVLNMKRERRPTSLIPFPHMFTPFIAAYTKQGEFDKARDTYKQLRRCGTPVTHAVYASLMSLYRHEQRYSAVEAMWTALYESNSAILEDLDPDLGPIPLPGQDQNDTAVLSIRSGLYYPELDIVMPPDSATFALSIYVDALVDEQRFDTIEDLWHELQQRDHPLDMHNWNRYIVALVSSGDLTKACRVTVGQLMGNNTDLHNSEPRPQDDPDISHYSLHARTCLALAEALNIPAYETMEMPLLRTAVKEHAQMMLQQNQTYSHDTPPPL